MFPVEIIFNNNISGIKQRMLSTKRRPTSSLKNSSKSRLEPTSALSHKRMPTPHDLVLKKYYLPVRQEDERHRAFQISRFIAGFHNADSLGLSELQKLYSEQEWLAKYHVRPHDELQQAVYDHFHGDDGPKNSVRQCSLHFYGFAFYLQLENHRKMKEYIFKRSFAKKQSQRSTDYSSKKEMNVLGTFSKILKDKEKLNESHELNKLSQCLKNLLKKHDKGKSYKTFLEDMEKRKTMKEGEKSQGLLQLIDNLEKDFSSIHQQVPQPDDFSKESIYGLSDLKKKSDKNHSKLQPKPKDKRLSTNFVLCKMDFVRKLRDVEKTTKGTSNSKNSRKSTSVRSKKGNNTNAPSTPDNHHNSKSKSRTKKITLKPATDKKSKLTDTERLYFDDGPEKNEEKQQSKSSLLKEGIKKLECDPLKSKKKLVKR